MEKVSINDINLAYDRRGKGQPLLLVHGYPLDHTTWEAVVPSLEDQYDILMPDLRGFGFSDAPGGAYRVEQLASDLAALLDALGIEKTFLAGHSMGGYISLAFARAYPDRVLGLGLVSSQAAADPPERKAARYAQADKVSAQGVGFLADEMAPKLCADPKLAPFFREVILRQRPAGVAGAVKAIAERPDSLDLVKSFEFHLVLVHGLADALIPPDRSRDIAARLPAAKLLELAGIGHSPQLEAPHETANVLKLLLQ